MTVSRPHLVFWVPRLRAQRQPRPLGARWLACSGALGRLAVRSMSDRRVPAGAS